MRSRSTSLNGGRWLALALALALTAAEVARAANILVNTNFSENSGQAVATGWSYFDDPSIPSTTKDYWIGGPPTGGFSAQPLSGTQYWKQWGAGYFPAANNVAGIYQTFGSSPGSVYQAAGWVYSSSSDQLGADCYVWLDVSFFDNKSNLLALYRSANFSSIAGVNTWVQLPVTNACDLASPVSTGDPSFTDYAISGPAASLLAPTGTTQVRFRFNYLQVAQEGGSVYLDDPELDQVTGLLAPVISNLFPRNMIFIAPSNGLTFDVSSPSGTAVNANGVEVILNGVNVSSNLTVAGSSSNKTVSCFGLQSNTVYNASISVTDALGLVTTASDHFETTWVGIPPILYLWEAEDFDFTNGLHLDFPDLCNADGDPNCYWGKVGTPGVDEQPGREDVSHLYRPADAMNIDVSGDYLRENLYLAGRTDFELNPFDQGEWVNYTRDFVPGTYWIIGRLSTDITLSGSLTMSLVNTDGSLTQLGTFTIAPHGLGWTTFENIFLLDANGNKVNVPLGGKTTLQVQSQGNLLPNFFALVVATVDLPVLTAMYPTGTHPFEPTNALSFNVSTIGATFPSNGITVILDGFNVSSNLVITGSASNPTAVYPALPLNAQHTAIIAVTNSLGHGILITNSFDTFNRSNYMVQASDFDYNGGQYVPDSQWYPNAYAPLSGETNIDFQHSPIAGEQYPYRPDGIPQEQGHDYLTPTFVDFGGVEWDLAWFGPGDWANYTRTYPAGSYFVYARTAGLGTNTMELQQITNGSGTTNQTVKTLGTWTSVGVNNQTYYWEEMTDAGLAAPAVVQLSGQQTLRLTTTTGDVYPNYFMLVPAQGIELSAAKTGNGAAITFPSQAGVVYRVFSRPALDSGSWSLWGSVLGNGATQRISVTSAANSQFYRVSAP